MLDGIEDQRQLSIIEKNFRRILENHTRKLMEAKRIYWRNRAKIRWTKLGDENTKFFHTVATKNYRRNIITSIVNQDGTEITNHEHKAAIIWNSYKDRVGISDDPVMLFPLAQIVQSHDLAHLDDPFTLEEINDVVKEMPTDRAPGPDGFNGLFMKKNAGKSSKMTLSKW
jgi:hypothetical protein